MIIFLYAFISCSSLIANTTLDFAGSKGPNPNYLIVSPIFSQHKYFHIYNLISSHSFYSSFIHSISTSLRIERSSFSYFLESVIRSSTANYHPDCTNRRVYNQGLDYFPYDSVSVDGCSFNSITSTDPNRQGGAIGLQNLKKIEIKRCNFTRCSAIQGGGFWIYNCMDLTLVKDNFFKCESGSSGSSAFVFMNCKFNASQILVSNCYEKSNGNTGTVYIKDSSGNFQYSTFSDNIALKMANIIELYALLSFEKCNISISDICFSYPNKSMGRPFMKIYVEACNFLTYAGINKITFPDFENINDGLIFSYNSVAYGNPTLAFNSSQDELCHLDFFVFQEGIIMPTPKATPDATNTPEATLEYEENFTSSSEEDTTSSINEETTSDIIEETTSDINEETTSDINEETTSNINEETISDINEETTSDINEETTSNINEETTSDINEETTSDINEETTTIEETQEEVITSDDFEFETSIIGSIEEETTTLDETEIDSTSHGDNAEDTTSIDEFESEKTTFEADEEDTTNEIFEGGSTSYISIETEETEAILTKTPDESTTELEINDQKEKPSDITFPLIISLSILLFLIIVAIIISLCFICKKKRVAFSNDDTESSVDYEVPLIDYKLDNTHDILSPQQI